MQISAFVSSGEILAILGPSGSGKTTLLNALTLEPGPGATSGAFAVDGNPVDASTFIKYCAYVPREDNLWATMTARAHISLAFKCYRPELAAAERAAKVDEILAVTGMESCQETRAGDALRPGLSGGQRRRLSLAIALIKQPKLVVLDEPTSGLDSAAAAAITKLLKVSARRTNACIVCTVHQPSAAMVAGFDKVFILAEGRTAFVGPTPTLTSHLATIGFDAPSDCNPAEFVLGACHSLGYLHALPPPHPPTPLHTHTPPPLRSRAPPADPAPPPQPSAHELGALAAVPRAQPSVRVPPRLRQILSRRI